jgi:thioredoxin 1
MIINIESKEQFEQELKHGVVLVDFWAPWCGPCRMLAPQIEEVEATMPKLKVLKVNVDEQEAIAATYNVSAIPTLYLFINGEEVNHNVGFMNKVALKKFIESSL